jgi:hypothetical protein
MFKDFSTRVSDRNITAVRIPTSAIAMQDVREPSKSPDFGGDLTPYFEMINSLRRERVSQNSLEEIMRMATQPELIRPVAVRGS